MTTLSTLSLTSLSLSLSLAFMIIFSISSLRTLQATSDPPLFVFGDSFYDTGNTNYLANAMLQGNVTPYGETFFKFSSGRFSNGRVIPDLIAELADLPFPLPYLLVSNEERMTYRFGVNFACAGAGALNETYEGTVISLLMQVDNYREMVANMTEKLGQEMTNMTLSNAVYLLNIGTNDIVYALEEFTEINDEFRAQVIGNITTAIKEIYALGGRKFGINNVGPLGCLPLVKAIIPTLSRTCIPAVSQFAALHNELLSEALSELATEFEDIKYGLFDMYNNLENIIYNYTSYGYTENQVACCGSGLYRGIFDCGKTLLNVATYKLCDNPEEHVFWDSIHSTETTYKLLAALIWAGNTSDIGPYNVSTLFDLSIDTEITILPFSKAIKIADA